MLLREVLRATSAAPNCGKIAEAGRTAAILIYPPGWWAGLIGPLCAGYRRHDGFVTLPGASGERVVTEGGIAVKRFLIGATLVCAVVFGVSAAMAFNPDTLVNFGSPPGPFSQNKQNEPALAVDASHPNILVAGANDERDMEACSRRRRQHVPVHARRWHLWRLLLVR
jgi:hypothetical protein